MTWASKLTSAISIGKFSDYQMSRAQTGDFRKSFTKQMANDRILKLIDGKMAKS